jgi:hypothetical protein
MNSTDKYYHMLSHAYFYMLEIFEEGDNKEVI